MLFYRWETIKLVGSAIEGHVVLEKVKGREMKRLAVGDAGMKGEI